MSYYKNAKSYVSQQRARETNDRLRKQMDSVKQTIQRKAQELRTAPAYKRDCILEKIQQSEKSYESLKSSLASHRRQFGC